MSRKKWFIAVALIVVGVGVALALSLLDSGDPVNVVEVRRGTIRQFIDERGQTRLPEVHLITMPYNGRIEDIKLDEGTSVEQGQIVARIVPAELDLQLEQAEAVVERLEAAIRENADNRVEETAYKQAVQFVESMRSTVEAAAARVESGEAKLDYAEKNLGRIQKLFEEGAQTQDALDRAVLEKVEAGVDYRQDVLVYAAMQALQAATDLLPTMVRQYIDRKQLREGVLEKERAEAVARLRQVEHDIELGVMRSPVDGIVLARHISDERYLTAGTQLLEIGRLEDLEVEADILSLDVVGAEVGDPVEVYGPAIGPGFAGGKVERIYPAGFTKISSLGVEQQRVKVIVKFLPDELARLRKQRELGVGYRVRVRIITASKSDALLVPRSSLFRGDDTQWQVFAVHNGEARSTPLEIGLINDESAEVISGLKQGDLVVGVPESSLSDGAKVDPVRSKNSRDQAAPRDANADDAEPAESKRPETQ